MTKARRSFWIDGLVRQNAKVALGGNVTVRKADVREAQEIVLAPVIEKGHKMSFGHGLENFVKRGLFKRPLIKGDIVIVPGIVLLGWRRPLRGNSHEARRYGANHRRDRSDGARGAVL